MADLPGWLVSAQALEAEIFARIKVRLMAQIAAEDRAEERRIMFGDSAAQPRGVIMAAYAGSDPT